MDGRMGGWTEGWEDGSVDGWKDGLGGGWEDGCLDGQMGKKEGGMKKTIFFSFVIISVNDTQSMTHLEELQNKHGLRHAELRFISGLCSELSCEVSVAKLATN